MNPFENPLDFLNLLYTSDLQPAQFNQMVQHLAMKAPPPGGGGFPQPPGAAQLPPGTVMSGMDSAEAPKKPPMGALNPQQMMGFSKMLEQPAPHYMPAVSPPAMRGLTQNMAQFQTPSAGMPMGLWELLQRGQR
jgi:hypothetical protein